MSNSERSTVDLKIIMINQDIRTLDTSATNRTLDFVLQSLEITIN